MGDQKLLLILSQSFLGTGFFFLYVYHVRSIFESRTNIEHGEQLERESLLRREDALYYSFYKTLTEGDFWAGYEKLRNVTDIEYPNSVNVLKRFHVLPELGIAYLYHLWKYYAQSAYIPFLSCWRSTNGLPMELRECDTAGQAMQFYLEFVWILGGFTVLTIYLYGTLLSYNVFGGVYAVVSYAMFHSCYAAKIYDRPVARENFAFPFILLQMFHLCMRMNRTGKRKTHKSRLIFIYNQTILTTIALLCWQFSSVIFASQILIMMTPWSFNPNMPAALNTLTIDYSLSQLIANALGFYLSFGNKKYAFAWQVGPAISLLFISLNRRLKNQQTSQESLQMQSIKTTAMGLILAASAQSCFTDLLEKSGLVRSSDNSFTLYRDLLLHWVLQAKLTFATSLAACNSAYERMIWTDLWQLVKTLIVKPYCLYGVVMLAKFFRKWRKNDETKNPSEEFQERMRKYVLEDFLETNHVSMSDLSNKETEELLNQCLELLSQCNFDYDQYKKKKAEQSKGNENEHKEFINDIRNLKKRINALNRRKSKEESSEQTTIMQNDEENTEEQHSEPPKLQGNSPKNKRPMQTDDVPNENPPSTSSITSNGIGKSNSDVAPSQRETLEFHYVYSFIQLVVFTAVGLCVRKLFFLSFTLGCIIAPTMCSKFCFRNQRDIFWTISLTVFLTSIVNPGLVNIHEEYYPHSTNGNDDLDTMLQWIKMNTEKAAVFAGPIDIIGTVHLTTKRPIVNHAHLEMPQISERTEYVYSVFSRQQSSDVYNQCSQLKIQYLIISLKDCTNKARDECDLLFVWDDMQPAYRKYPQFCSEIVNKNIPSFLKVFSNGHFTIIKMFSQSVQISLRRSLPRMPELAI